MSMDWTGDKAGDVIAKSLASNSHSNGRGGDFHHFDLTGGGSDDSGGKSSRLSYVLRTGFNISTSLISKFLRHFQGKTNTTTSTDIYANSGDNTYRYATIPGLQGIRLISLDPGVGPDPLRCCIEYTTFSESETYEAVSYVWGDPTPVTPVEIGAWDNHEASYIMVSWNCGEALRRLRLPHSPRLLWLDSICINQADLHEKSDEVGRMDRIFASASKVLVYLGPGTFEGMEVLEMLLSSDPRSLEEREISSVKRLFGLPWFTRTWVIQEVYLAKVATLYDDQRSVPWEYLLYVARCIRGDAGYLVQPSAGGFSTLDEIPCVLELALQRQKNHVQHSILELMEKARRCKTTDSRDKVYAFAGICPELNKLPFPEDVSTFGAFKTAAFFHRPTYGNLLYDEDDPRCWKDIQRFKPSYNLSQEAMMRLFTVCWIAGSRSTEILCSVQSPHTRPHFPSFVADWDAPQKYDVLGCPDMGHLRRPSPDMMDLQVPYSIARVRFSPDARLLNIRGTEIGRVDAVGPLLSDIDDPRATLLSWYEIVEATLWRQAIFAPGEIMEMFWRTVVADTDERGNSPARYSRGEFMSCVRYLDEGKRSLNNASGIDKYRRPPLPDWIQAPLRHASQGRRFITVDAKGGLIGIGPPETHVGDVLVALSGSRIPFILRPTGADPDAYTLVGECYLYDIMRMGATPNAKQRWFSLQ